MATIQVRDLPEESYEVLRRRARRAGQSIQAYMRGQIINIASQPTKDEAVERIEATLGAIAVIAPTASSVLDDLDAERR